MNPAPAVDTTAVDDAGDANFKDKNRYRGRLSNLVSFLSGRNFETPQQISG